MIMKLIYNININLFFAHDRRLVLLLVLRLK